MNWDALILEQLLPEEKVDETASSIQIPKCITSKNAMSYEPHAFVNTSENAFAVVYLRNVTKSGANISLVAAKTKVALIKNSITKLKLHTTSALGIRFSKIVRKELRVISVSRVG